MSERPVPESQHEAPALRRHLDGFGWSGVERLPYKEGADAPFRGVARQILFSRTDLAGELRYFEVEPGGHTTLERHGHVHGVIIIRGRGRCLVGSEIAEIGPLDLVTIPGWTWHQFRAGLDEPLGFLCLVDASRDRPVLPTSDELAALRSAPELACFLDG